MKICITGATGFVGAHLVRHFANKNHEIIAIGRQKIPPSTLLEFATWVQADITQPMPTIECDICIHAAGLADDKGAKAAFFAANVLGTKHVFESVTAPVFIHISSASVYPFLNRKLVETDAILNPQLSNYGYSKLQAEQFLKKYAYQKKTVIVFRPRAIYGTNDRVLLPRILQMVKFNKLWLPGKGQIAISMTHISNLVSAIEQAIRSQLSNYQCFNVADGVVYELRNIIEKIIADCYQKQFSIKELPINWLKNIVKTLVYLKIPTHLSSQSLNYLSYPTVLDLRTIREELAYQPTTNFMEKLPEIAHWVQKVGLENVVKNKVNLTWDI